MWVALAKIGVERRGGALWLTAPRFNASTRCEWRCEHMCRNDASSCNVCRGRSVPGDFGGVFYCRLVPPNAFDEWITSNYHGPGPAA